MATAIEVFGFILVMVMGSAMDSASIFPAVGVIAGMAFMFAGYQLERRGF